MYGRSSRNFPLDVTHGPPRRGASLREALEAQGTNGTPDEVAELASYGMPAEYVLGAASWRAREWLGQNATLDEGAPADFVVYPRDPRADLSVLREPSAVVLRGHVR